MISPLLLLGGFAFAQEPPTIAEAQAVAPEACPQAQPCPEAPPCPDHSADDALLARLLELLDAETGAQAAAQLGELGDPRAVAPLIHTARTRRLEVARPACMALARYPDALGGLAELARDEGLRVPVRQAAVEALGLMGSEEAATALVALMDADLPRDVRESVLATVRTVYPHRLAELEGEVAQRGTGWLMVGGAGALGYSLASVGYFGQADLEVLGAITGGAAGGSLGYVAGRRWPIEGGDAAFLSSTGLVGTVSGVLLGTAIDYDNDTASWTGGLLGEAAGFGLGAMLMDDHLGTQGDTVEALVTTGATALSTGATTSWMMRRYLGPLEFDGEWGEDDWRREEEYWDKVGRATQLATGLGLAGGLAVGHWVAPRVELSGSDIGQMTLGATYGGFSGGLLGADESEGSSLAAGMGLGTLAGYGLANRMELGGDAVFTGYMGLGYGSMVGLGAALVADNWIDLPASTGGDLTKATVWVTGSAGMGLGSYLAWKNPEPIKANDLVFTGLSTGWATWQTTGWWNYADQPEETLGLLFLVPAAVGSTAAIASPRIDIGVGDTLSATSLGLWGTYLGLAGSALADADGDETLLATLIASDVGLGTGILLMSPAVDASPVVVGLADAGGVVGATMGAVIVALATGDQDPILWASLVGAGAGAVGGGLAGRAIERSDRDGQALLLPKPRLRLPGRWSLAPTTVTDGESVGYGAGLQITGW
jgi:hypothetical protein